MFSRLCSPGVAMLAVALLALALIPAAAGPGTTVTVDEFLPADLPLAMYTEVDNPCTPGKENITLQGRFYITGSVKFTASGLTYVSMKIYSDLSGSDTTGGSYVSKHRSSVWGTITPGAPRDFRGTFLVVNPLDATTPNFWLFVHFRVSEPGALPIVTFYPDPNNPYGFYGTQCQ